MAEAATAGPAAWTMLVVAGVSGLSWAGGAASAREAGHHPTRSRPLAGLLAFAEPMHPGSAWHGPVGPTPLYWANVVAVFVLAASLTVVTRLRLSGSSGQGFAARSEIRAAAGPRSLKRRSAALRPTVHRPTVEQLGIRLGRAGGVSCWASIEDSVVILGPPRSGKGLHLVIPSILNSPGAVVTTSTRPDNLRATLNSRRLVGPVAVFDPQGLSDVGNQSLRWSPIRGCEQPGVAMARARALCASPDASLENSSFWAQQCYTVVRCLLHAAALSQRSSADLAAWALSPVAAKTALTILLTNDRAAPTWATALDAVLNADPRQRDSVWAMVGNVFACLADPDVLAAISPSPGEEFDVASLLQAGGTLYLLGTAAGASATANLVNALVEDIVECARRLASATPAGRLDPPLALVLDEAANYPLPSLLPLMSEGGGSGISTQVVLQSMAQARAKWGDHEAAAVWDSAIVKVVLGGSSNAGDLQDLSALLGTKTERRATESGPMSERERPVLDVGSLRTIRFGQALLLLRSAAPIRLSLEPWTKSARPHRT